jgi:hypothetical protein
MMASSCFIYNSFRADYVMLFISRYILSISSHARENVTISPSPTKLIPNDITSISFEWLFRSKSRLKLVLRGTRVDIVFRN